MKNISLHHGDVLQTLKTLPDSSVDAVITDPPYCSGGAQRNTKQSTSKKYCTGGKSCFAEFEGDQKDQHSFAFWMSMWLAECYRIAKPHTPVCIFTNWQQLPTMSDALQAAGYRPNLLSGGQSMV